MAYAAAAVRGPRLGLIVHPHGGGSGFGGQCGAEQVGRFARVCEGAKAGLRARELPCSKMRPGDQIADALFAIDTQGDVAGAVGVKPEPCRLDEPERNIQGHLYRHPMANQDTPGGDAIDRRTRAGVGEQAQYSDGDRPQKCHEAAGESDRFESLAVDHPGARAPKHQEQKIQGHFSYVVGVNCQGLPFWHALPKKPFALRQIRRQSWSGFHLEIVVAHRKGSARAGVA